MGKLAIVFAKVFLDLQEFVRDSLRGGIHGVDHDDNLDWGDRRGGGLVDCLKGHDLLGGLVVEEGEVLLLEAGLRLTGFVADDDVQRDQRMSCGG